MQIAKTKKWDELDKEGAVVRHEVQKAPEARRVGFIEHTLVAKGDGGVQCALCGRWARTQRARQQLEAQDCKPTQLQRMLAVARLEAQAACMDLEVDDLELEAPKDSAVQLAMLAVERGERSLCLLYTSPSPRD